MKQCGREQSQVSADATCDANNNRQRQLEHLYQQNYNFIIDAALADGRLLIADAEHVASSVAKFLPDYDGPLTDGPFQQWVTEIIAPAVSRLSSFYDLKARYSQFVLSGIWRTLGHSAEPNKFDDYGAVVEELANDVWLWAFLHIDELVQPGTAELSTRLYARASLTALAWKGKQQTRRNAVLNRLATSQGFEDCETLSDTEIAALKVSAKNQEAAA